ncbi:hypothetical protein [Amycolatopsis sp. NPDC004625]|uniref:hypothetical protein n=1 Tax=Amycolatopsis sp. NPDC004625 TaxID=3154670 RepID=UPI0033B6A9A4
MFLAGPRHAPVAAREAPVQPRPLLAGLDPRAVVDVPVFYQRVQDLSDAVYDHLSES